MIEFEPYYTRSQVAEKLGISESTVYKYASDQKIRALPNPNKMRSQDVYYTKEVDQLADERAELLLHKEDVTISQLATDLGIKRQQVSYMIASNQMEVNRIQVSGRTKITLPKGTVEAIRSLHDHEIHHSEKYKRQQYYNESLNLLLLQPFKDDQGSIYRADVRDGIWGYFSQKSGFIPHEQLESSTLNLIPLYSIKPDEKKKETSYLTFQIAKSAINQEQFLVIYDFFVEQLGVHQIKLNISKDFIEFSIIQSIINLQVYPLPSDITFELLNSYVIRGELSLVGAELFVIGHSQKAVFEVERAAYEQLQVASNDLGISKDDLLNKILLEYFKL